MSNVKRWEPYYDSYDWILGMQPKPDGGYVEFADYERLRDALEKIQLLAVVREAVCSNGDYKAFVRLASEALTPPPAVGSIGESDDIAAARKEKERAGSLEETDAPKAARKGKDK